MAISPPRPDWVPEADLGRGTDLLVHSLLALSDADLDEPSRLPGWTRRHVLAHLAGNARALTRLCDWAATGVESRMYTSAAQRLEEIQQGATAPAAALREAVVTTADTLAGALDALPAARRGVHVVTALGRTVPATEIPWLRAREVWLHTIDLGGEARASALPRPFSRRLVTEVCGWLDARADAPALALTCPDESDGAWRVSGTGDPTSVHAPVAELAGWLTGRAAIAGAPPLPAWI